jgi:hypothetical protein
MKSRFLKTLIIFGSIGVIIWLSLRIFTYWFWSEWDIDRTIDAFQKNRSSFNNLVAWADNSKSEACIKKSNLKDCLPLHMREVFKKYGDTSVSYHPLTIETAPVNFYYVLVYTKYPKDVEESAAYHDEGKIIQTVEHNWTLVRRGWM